MAKKTKYFLEYKLNAKCIVHIDPDGRETLLKDIARGEVALSLNYTLDPVIHSVSVYPDYIEGGELTFTQVSEDRLEVLVNGSYFNKLDPKWEQDLIDNWQSLGELKAHSNSIYDSEPTSHYINGSRDAFEVGTVSLVEK